jgi:hypothetical protein
MDDSPDPMALDALLKAKAVEICDFHPEVVIRLIDDDAERHAYALATAQLKAQGRMWQREDIMIDIRNQLAEAADEECPRCAHFRDD